MRPMGLCMIKRPNLLFLLSDQLRYDCVGAAGCYPVSTPNIDRLADRGMWFENAYTPMPVCAPARQCLLSGVMADRFGAVCNYDMLPVPSLEPTGRYWTDNLSRSGYRSAFVGKWHASKSAGADAFGFSDIYTFADYNAYLKERYGDLKESGGWLGSESVYPLADSKTHHMAEKVNEYIRSYKGEAPWHIRLDLTDPHLPCHPAAPYSAMYNPDDMQPWESFGDTFENKPYIQRQHVKNWGIEHYTWDDFKGGVARYYGMISQLDDAIGRIMSTLEQTGQKDDTIVVFTSDHGDLCGGHGMLDKHYVLYDDVLHVPLIISYPRMVGQGRDASFVNHFLDLVPTIEELCGISPEMPRSGRTLVPLLLGQEQPERPDFIVASGNGQQFGYYTHRCIRTERYKYIWNLTDIDECYDLADDPGEKVNIIDKMDGEVLKKLKRTLLDELTRLEDPFIKGHWVRGQLEE